MREYTEQELVRREKAKKLLEKNIDPFGSKYDITSDSKTIKELYSEMSNEEFLKALEDTDGEIYEIDEKQEVSFVDSEYLFETEVHYNGSETLVVEGNKVIGTVV